MNNDRPNFYAIIPATVRYDYNLTPNAKLLYAEITALCNEKGFCWAKNNYFSKLFNISDRQTINLLNQLKKYNYILIDIQKNNKRKIFLSNVLNLKDALPNNNKKIVVDIPNYDWLNDN